MSGLGSAEPGPFNGPVLGHFLNFAGLRPLTSSQQVHGQAPTVETQTVVMMAFFFLGSHTVAGYINLHGFWDQARDCY